MHQPVIPCGRIFVAAFIMADEDAALAFAEHGGCGGRMSIFSERRSIKPAVMDLSRDVPREVLTEILEDAHRAPTHGLTQPWRFFVFTGAARARLGDGLQELYDATTPVAARNDDKRAKLGATPRLAPVVIAVAMRVEPNGKIPEVEEIAATACAVENLMLSAHDKGIGAYWSTPPVTMSSEFAAWLGLDAGCRGLGLIYAGYPLAGKIPPPSPRRPLSDNVVFYED